MIDLTDIIIAVLALLFAVVVRYAIPFIRETVDAARFDKLEKWVRVAVEAAEMIFRETGAGAEKKEYVLEFLEERGFTVDAAAVDNMIESAVLELRRE